MSIYCCSPGVISSKFVAKTWITYPCPMSELFWCSWVDVIVWAFLNLSHCLPPGVWPNGWVQFFGLSELIYKANYVNETLHSGFNNACITDDFCSFWHWTFAVPHWGFKFFENRHRRFNNIHFGSTLSCLASTSGITGTYSEWKQ